VGGAGKVKEELSSQHQRMLLEFEAALQKNQTIWSESAKDLTKSTLQAALRAARENAAQIGEEAARNHAGMLRSAIESYVARLEAAVRSVRRFVWPWRNVQVNPTRHTLNQSLKV
jgi:predicted component of type VI protein secretion system